MKNDKGYVTKDQVIGMVAMLMIAAVFFAVLIVDLFFIPSSDRDARDMIEALAKAQGYAIWQQPTIPERWMAEKLPTFGDSWSNTFHGLFETVPCVETKPNYFTCN